MPFFVYDSHRLFYREKGWGPLLLILPGNTSSSACHEGELEHFGQTYHAMALDLRGTGKSGRVKKWPDDWWEEGAHAAAALVAHVGQERCIVMGTSGGALIALLMAILHPERVEAIVADSVVERYPAGWLEANMEERNQQTQEQVRFWQFAQGEDWPRVVDADTDFLIRFSKQGGDCLRGRLSEIRCPTLFTASLCDRALPEVGRQIPAMAAQIQGSRTFLVNRGGHPLMWSCPEDFRDMADWFLQNLQRSSQRG